MRVAGEIPAVELSLLNFTTRLTINQAFFLMVQSATGQVHFINMTVRLGQQKRAQMSEDWSWFKACVVYGVALHGLTSSIETDHRWRVFYIGSFDIRILSAAVRQLTGQCFSLQSFLGLASR